MIQQLLESGVINATVWFVLVAALMLRLRAPWRPSTLLIVVLAVGTMGNMAAALYRAYAVPRDVLQDVVSARELLGGRPLYPPDMTRRMNVALIEEGERPSLLAAWASLHQREKDHRQEALTSHWVQAHPPFMTLFTSPFVRFLGVLGTQIAFVVLAVLALAATLWMLGRDLAPDLSSRSKFVILLALLGWDPVLTVLRSQQVGLILGVLLTATWFLLRRGRPIEAGLAAGLAISLKLIPGLILPVLLMRNRRAFVSAIITLLVMGIGTLAATSPGDFLDFLRTSRSVVDEYAAYADNFSLLGMLARGTRDLDGGLELARVFWLGLSVMIVSAFFFQMYLSRASIRRLDLEMALVMTLMPLLSPVAWDHYLVLLILPLAVQQTRVGWHPALLGLLILFAIPQTTYDWLVELFSHAGHHRLGLWLILPLRTLGVALLAMWLARTSNSSEMDR